MPFLRSCPHLNNNNGSREKADKVLDGFESIATVRHILDACLGRVNARWAREKIEQPFLPSTTSLAFSFHRRGCLCLRSIGKARR